MRFILRRQYRISSFGKATRTLIMLNALDVNDRHGTFEQRGQHNLKILRCFGESIFDADGSRPWGNISCSWLTNRMFSGSQELWRNRPTRGVVL